MIRNLLIAALILTAAVGVAIAQPREVSKIDALVKSTDAIIKHKGPELIFADVADQESSDADWRKFASEKELEKHRESSETYSIAYVWRSAGKVAAANFTLFSGSGDWANYVHYYYRPDGTLAKVEVDYRTFYGDLILEQNIYFAADGRQIKKTQRVLDLTTHKPKRLTKSVREQAASMAKEVDFFRSTSALPFAKLLK